jgi:hypothetical protein
MGGCRAKNKQTNKQSTETSNEWLIKLITTTHPPSVLYLPIICLSTRKSFAGSKTEFDY